MTQLKELFVSPGDEYTPFPFWFWNGELTDEEIERQMRAFHAKGIRGVIIHPRIGIPKEIEYLGPRFFGHVAFAVALAKELEMKIILYDEAMYPSGSAHGEVVKANPAFSSRGIYLVSSLDFQKVGTHFQEIVAAYEVVLHEGEISSVSHVVAADTVAPTIYYLVYEESLGTIRGIHFGEDDGEAQAPRSSDLLNKEACQLFVELTHQKYYDHLMSEFGQTIIGFFTDEPAILGRNYREGMLPYNKYVEAELQQVGITKEDLIQLFIDAPSTVKVAYDQIVYDLLSESYYGTLSKWCDAHGIFLTGHPEDSEDIGLLQHFHVPGQDVVWRWVAPENNLGISGPNSTMAKCSSDAARHLNRRRNANECFGCCGYSDNQWSFSTDEMKWYLDWLFVRGVNMIYPHAFFYSIEGKRIEDRAPDVGMNNLWWAHYDYFVTYIKRMSYMLTDSVNQTNIAVLCQKNHLPHQGLEHFYQNQIEFNYLEDELLYNGACQIKNNKLIIQQQVYDTLIVAQDYPQKDKIQELLKVFVERGGNVIVLADPVDVALDQVRNCYKSSLKFVSGERKNLRYTNFMKNQQEFHLLSNEGDKLIDFTIELPTEVKQVELWHPWSGQIEVRDVEKGSVSLNLERRSTMIITPTDLAAKPTLEACWAECSSEIEVTTSHPTIDGLGSWTSWPGLSRFSGTVTYELKLEFANERGSEVFKIDLGVVDNFATLKVNGLAKDTVFWAPYTFELSLDELLNGKIEIEVTNTLSNRYDHQPLQSGLLGPISVYERLEQA